MKMSIKSLPLIDGHASESQLVMSRLIGIIDMVNVSGVC